HQELVRARRLDRVQVRPLEVLDQRELETIAHVVADDRRDRRLAGDPRGEHAAMARNEFVAVAVARDHYWLQNAVALDRGRELADAIGVEVRPRLLGIGTDALERDLRRANCFNGRRSGPGCLTEKDVETAPETS